GLARCRTRRGTRRRDRGEAPPVLRRARSVVSRASAIPSPRKPVPRVLATRPGLPRGPRGVGAGFRGAGTSQRGGEPVSQGCRARPGEPEVGTISRLLLLQGGAVRGGR